MPGLEDKAPVSSIKTISKSQIKEVKNKIKFTFCFCQAQEFRSNSKVSSLFEKPNDSQLGESFFFGSAGLADKAERH